MEESGEKWHSTIVCERELYKCWSVNDSYGREFVSFAHTLFIAYTVAYRSINHLSIYFVVICRLHTPHCMQVDTHCDCLYFRRDEKWMNKTLNILMKKKNKKNNMNQTQFVLERTDWEFAPRILSMLITRKFANCRFRSFLSIAWNPLEIFGRIHFGFR